MGGIIVKWYTRATSGFPLLGLGACTNITKSLPTSPRTCDKVGRASQRDAICTGPWDTHRAYAMNTGESTHKDLLDHTKDGKHDAYWDNGKYLVELPSYKALCMSWALSGALHRGWMTVADWLWEGMQVDEATGELDSSALGTIGNKKPFNDHKQINNMIVSHFVMPSLAAVCWTLFKNLGTS